MMGKISPNEKTSRVVKIAWLAFSWGVSRLYLCHGRSQDDISAEQLG
jgi:hypothetical protein